MHRNFIDTLEPDVSDANLDVGSTFIQIGEPALAVVMRLQTRLPRIKVASPSTTLRRETEETGSLS